MWGIIALLVIAAFFGSVAYIVSRMKKYGFWWKIAEKKKEMSGKVKTLISLLALVLIFCGTVFAAGLMNAVIILIHLVLFLGICDVLFMIIKTVRKKEWKHYYSGAAAVVLTAVYLSYGYYNAEHVSRTEYSLVSERLSGELKIVQFADAHVGTTFDGKGILKYIEIMNEEDPDIVLITGDFIDDSTPENDMVDACVSLGKLKTRYGVYFSFGNHDKGYYGQPRGERLISEMEKNGIVVLEDETVMIDGRIRLIGRNDASENTRGNGRLDMSEYPEIPDIYTIVMDHQPNDYENEALAGADLVLSGHTHGGQFFPINRAGEWIGANDWTYGYIRKDNTDFIVSSGISDWEFNFKTGCHSEYNVINIKGK